VSEPKLADVALFWRKQGETSFASDVQYDCGSGDACAKSSRLFYEEQL